MNKKLTTALWISLVAFTGVASMSGTISWFVQRARIQPDVSPIEGTTDSSYFAYGNGKKGSANDSPFGITRPRHLYNLAWLTYLGYFTEPTYFELADNIDMTGWTLPPIGTPENPFIGNFNGSGYVISNLTISNDFEKFGNKHPSIVTKTKFDNGDNPLSPETETNNYPNIVGFFGVVGNYKGKYSNAVYSSEINEIKNFGLSNVSVETIATETLIGVVGGYVSGTIQDVAVDTTTINIADDGAQTIGETGITNLSDYSIVGYTTKTKQVRKIDESIYRVNVKGEDEFNVPDGGDGVGWGGSINMYDLYNRLDKMRTNLKNSGNKTNGSYSFRITTNRSAAQVESDPTFTSTTRNTTDPQSDTPLLTYYNTTNYEYGTYSIYNTGSSSNNNDYLYLMGGKNKVTTYWEYYLGTLITNTIGNTTNYMTVTSFTNGAAVINTTNRNSATTWIVPSKSTEYIYTQDPNAPSNRYYLTYVESNDPEEKNLSLKLVGPYTGDNKPGENEALVFTRTDGTASEGTANKVRFVYGNYYLNNYQIDSNNYSWVLSPMPTAPKPLGPEPLLPEGYPEGPSIYETKDYLTDGWLIYYTDDSGKRFYMGTQGYAADGTDKKTSYINAETGLIKGNNFGLSLANNFASLQDGNTTTISNGDRYVQTMFETTSGGFCNNPEITSDALVFNNSQSNYRNWRIYTKNGKKSFVLIINHPTKEGCNTVNKDWYICLNFNNGVFQLYDLGDYTSSQTFDSNNIPNTARFTVETIADVVDDLNNNEEYGVQALYDAAVSDHNKWVDSVEQYDNDYTTYDANLKNTFIIDVNSSENAGEFIDEANPAKNAMVFNYSYTVTNNQGTTTTTFNDTTYIPLNIKKDGAWSSDSDLAPTNSNTGYIVAGSNISGDTFGAGQSDIRVAKYEMDGYISDSFGILDEKLTNIWTIDDGGNRIISEKPHEIKDYSQKVSSYQKYAKSFFDFEGKLNECKPSVYGLRFFRGTISMDRMVTVPKVRIYNENQETYSNYQMPVDSIDFNLSDRGYINFFAGTYIDNGSNIDSFFSLHQIIRDENRQIIAIKEIQAIYSDGEDTHSYILQYKDAPIRFSIPYVIEDGVRYKLAPDPETAQDYSENNKHHANSTMLVADYNEYRTKRNYQMVFNTDWITNHSSTTGDVIESLAQDKLYYFEIPVNEGEYCLGSVPGGNGAYLNYLDIGANASRTQRTTISEHFTRNEKVYEYPIGVAYVNMPDEYKPGDGPFVFNINTPPSADLPENAILVDDANSVCVSLTVGYSGDFKVERVSDQVAQIRAQSSGAIPIYQGDSITTFTESSAPNKNLEITPKSTKDWDILRLSYYDYSAFLDDWTVTVIEDTATSTNGAAFSSYVREVYQYVHYHFGEDNSNNKITNPDDLNIYETGTGNKYMYVDGSYEFMDRNKLKNEGAFVDPETDILITVQTKQDSTDSSSTYTPKIVIVVEPYAFTSEITYCAFSEYDVTIIPVGTDVYLKVTYFNSNNEQTVIYILVDSEFEQITGTSYTVTIYAPQQNTQNP